MDSASSSLASRLRDACDKNNLEEVRRLLVQEGAVSVINDADDQGATALHFAAGWTIAKNYWDIRDALRKADAKVGAFTDANKATVVALSRSPDTATLVELLLGHGAQVDQQTGKRRTSPLICAAMTGQTSVVGALISAGANINAVNHKDSTALQLASQYGHEEVVSILLEAGSNINASNDIGRTAFLRAAFYGHAEVVSLLLTAGSNIEAKGQDGCTALHLATYKGHSKVVAFLLASGADVEASKSGESTALHLAAYNGQAEMVSLLLTAGADIEAKDNASGTALIDAAATGHMEAASLLLAAGADSEVKDKDGCTALMDAACRGHAEVVSLLLTAGTNIEAKDNGGKTALVHAAYGGHIDALGVLLSAGANVNTLFQTGLTPLIISIERGHPQIADAILTHGKNVDVGAVTSEGLTARDYAEKKGYGGIIRKLEVAARKLVHVAVATGIVQQTQRLSASFPTASSDLPSAKRPRAAPPTTPPPVNPNSDESSAAFHSSWLIPYSDLELGAELGRGSCARVYNATWKAADVAVKVFDLPGGLAGTRDEFSSSVLANISTEADLLASIRHPNVVTFFGMCHDPPCVVTEQCPRGSLFNILQQAKTDASSAAELSWARRLSMAIDAATGMLHLHQSSPAVMHRDVKSQNLLVDSNWRVKVSDLGLSKLVHEVNAVTPAMAADSTANQQLNPRYMAPEVARGGQTALSSDVYSFGVVLWELLTWELPWSHLPNTEEIIPCIVRGDAFPIPTVDGCRGPPPVHASTYSEYIALLKQCTARSPSERPSFATVVQKLKVMLKQEGGAGALGAWQGSFNNGAASIPVCVVCLEQPATAGLVHRSAEMVHRCCCEKCAKLLRSKGNACPLCRRPIDEVFLHFH